jgi:hypothetical protein
MGLAKDEVTWMPAICPQRENHQRRKHKHKVKLVKLRLLQLFLTHSTCPPSFSLWMTIVMIPIRHKQCTYFSLKIFRPKTKSNLKMCKQHQSHCSWHQQTGKGWLYHCQVSPCTDLVGSLVCLNQPHMLSCWQCPAWNPTLDNIFRDYHQPAGSVNSTM